MVNDIKANVFNKLAETIGSMPTGWTYETAFEGSKHRKEHPERVYNTVWHDGSRYRVEVHVNGTVFISVTALEKYREMENSHYFRPRAETYKLEFDNLEGLIQKVKEMINDENVKDFTEALETMRDANGVTYEEVKEQEEADEPEGQPDTTKAVIEPKPKGFWARLFRA